MPRPEKPTELSPKDAAYMGGILLFGYIPTYGGPEHLFYAWDTRLAWSLCDREFVKSSEDLGANQLTLTIGSSERACQHCFTERNELEQAYYDNHRSDP
jgi:hypothetical protein